jgi:hypothetical protein
MSDANAIDQLVHFAIVVEGEVAETIGMSPSAAKVIAALSSNPVIVPISAAQLKKLQTGTIENPWTYDGKKFIAPSS